VGVAGSLTIVMYHYVRDLARSRYPRIKGLDAADFAGQLEYMLRHYQPVRMEDVLAATRGEAELPPRSILLTFDDGYAEHFDVVYPLLDRLGVQGSFFPPASAVLDGKVLDVNKIHFVLASQPDVNVLVDAMERRIAELSAQFELEPVPALRERYAKPGRYDPAEVVYLKRVLQRGLPEEARARVVDELFARFVSADEAAFAAELYVSLEQLMCMKRHGMFIGSHSYDHVWLDSLTPVEQEDQVVRSLGFLEQVGVERDQWVMCYPYGGYDASLLDVIARHGCAAGLTTAVALADLGRPPELARIDTNDLPVSVDAPTSEWTVAA